MAYIFCAYRAWAIDLYKLLSKRYKSMILLSNPKKLTLNYVKKINPEFIFFPDWSWIVPEVIIENYKCICFHESDLPKFRGGSPIQNQIEEHCLPFKIKLLDELKKPKLVHFL